MKIDSPFAPVANNKEIRKQDERPPRPAPGEEARPEEATGDVVKLSDRARLAARATELAHAAPEVRQEKVDGLRNRIQAGSYDVSGRATAEALLRKSITEV